MQDTTQMKGKPFEALSGNSGSLRDWTRSIVDFQKSTLEQHNLEKEAQKEADAKNLFVSSLNSKDHGVSQECNSTFRLYQVAKGIRNYFAKPENGGYDYTNVDDDVLYDGYVKNNPDRKAQLDRYVLDDSQICDPTQLYQDMGWEEPEVVESNTESGDINPRAEAGVNAAGAVTESILGLPKFAGNLGADLGAWTIKLFGGDEERANAAAEEIKSYIDKLSFGDEDSLVYKGTKITSDLLLAYLLGKGLFPQTNIGNLGWGTKSLLGAAEGVGDMALYSMISEQESPSKGDINLGMGIGGFLPYGGLLWRGGKDFIKSIGGKEIERAIPKVSKLSEGRQDSFLKEFGQTFEEWMKERNLTTYDDLKNYFNASKTTKLDALKQIQGKYKSTEVDDVLDWCVDYAQKTKDPRLEEFLEYQTKNTEGGLEMWESEKIKQYFSEKGVFNFDGSKTSDEIDTLTNMYERLMNWQRKVAEENGFGNLAEINNEIQAGWYLNKYVKDLTKIGKKGMSLLDFVIAASTGDWKLAASYLLSKNILGSAKINEKYAKLLQGIFKNGNADKLAVDYEKIQAMQSEKEVIEYLKSLGIYDDALPYIEGGVDDAGKTILSDSETLIGTPEGKTVIKDKITEIPQASK